jgi:sulfite exporter TauE/SafE
LSDLLIKISEVSLLGIIPIGIGVGLFGSLHCIGMCGAFATSCSTQRHHSFAYHGGKILSYGLLGSIASLFGASFTYLFEDPYFKAIPAVLMGFLFVWLGLKSFSGVPKQELISMPKFLRSWVERGLGKSYQKEAGALRSFSIGFFSAFLPCGLLYGTLLAFAALQSPIHGALGMMSFSIGTIPGLTIAPHVLLKVLKPLKESWPRVSNIALVSLGLITISYRLVLAYGQANCH